MANFSQQRDRLQPSETLFNALPLSLTDGVPCMLCRAGIHRAPTRSLQILGHVRRNLQVPAFSYEIRRVVGLVAAHGHMLRSRNPFSITSTASRSAVPLASNTAVFTISPLRFSPEGSRCNSASPLCPCLYLPSSHPGPSSMRASGSTASPRGSPPSRCLDRPAERRPWHPCADNSSHSPTLPVAFHP